MIIAHCIAEVLQNSGEVETSLKWPNDVLIDEKKICGVLAEMEILTDGRKALVIGAGININQDADELPNRTILPATSLSLETNRKYEREPILIDILHAFSSKYKMLCSGKVDKLIEIIRKRMITIGKPVSLKSHDQPILGTAIDLTERGGLLVRLESGVEKEFLASDIEEVQWRL
jgi:BirA family biotin operon repressor/biotin-[acetyl-CoA-carboxylase] ligase